MRSMVASAALAAASLLLAAGHVPASAQDFSITNPADPADAGRRDMMRQLQAWWDVHAYYPRHASQADEGGTVRLHLVIRPDGNIFKADVVGSSGSASLDAAAASAFRGGFVRPFPSGAGAEIDLPLHYVLAHRHDQPVQAAATQAPSRRSFTITNDPVKSPILDTMLLRSCDGTMVTEGIRNHPMYGGRHSTQAIFFRKPDGTPWVRFQEGSYSVLAPVTELGQLVQWYGRQMRGKHGGEFYVQYTVWPEGENTLNGRLDVPYSGPDQALNHGGTLDLTCATQVVPAVAFNAWFVTPGQSPPGDPP